MAKVTLLQPRGDGKPGDIVDVDDVELPELMRQGKARLIEADQAAPAPLPAPPPVKAQAPAPTVKAPPAAPQPAPPAEPAK